MTAHREAAVTQAVTTVHQVEMVIRVAAQLLHLEVAVLSTRIKTHPLYPSWTHPLAPPCEGGEEETLKG